MGTNNVPTLLDYSTFHRLVAAGVYPIDWAGSIDADRLGIRRLTSGAIRCAIAPYTGWLYQRTRDLPLLVLVHALSNLIYTLFWADFVATWVPDLR